MNASLINNKRKITKTPTKFSCANCQKSFEWKSGLSRHKKYAHAQTTVKTCTCNICGRIFNKKARLSIHLKLHETNKTVKISQIYGNVISETVYSSDSDCEYEILQTIVKVREKGDKKCEVCGRVFVRQQSLNRHVNKHKTKETATADDRSSGVSHNCDKCGKAFRNACNLSNHLKLHLKESFVAKKFELNRNKVLLAKNTYPCSLCNRVYLKQSHLQNHLMLHEKSGESAKKLSQEKLYLCVICGKRYTRSSHLSLHMRTHVELKPHLCSVCGNCFLKKKTWRSSNYEFVFIYRKVVYCKALFSYASKGTCPG